MQSDRPTFTIGDTIRQSRSYDEWRAENERLCAENAKLREALEAYQNDPVVRQVAGSLRLRACTALKETSDEE